MHFINEIDNYLGLNFAFTVIMKQAGPIILNHVKLLYTFLGIYWMIIRWISFDVELNSVFQYYIAIIGEGHSTVYFPKMISIYLLFSNRWSDIFEKIKTLIFIKMFIPRLQVRNPEKILQANKQSPTGIKISVNKIRIRLFSQRLVFRD